VTTRKKILFIINPKAGTKSKTHLPQLIQQHLDSERFEVQITYTKAPSHATILAKEAVENQTDIVIATGGDGTVNEVMQGLLHSSTALGILPFGSGNGLARFLGVPMNHVQALKFINHASTVTIDTCLLNDHAFVNVAGTGFDAHIGNVFAHAKGRGFSTYIKLSIKEFYKYKPQEYLLTINEKILARKAFMISFANTSQFGNNAHIAPEADIQDGLVDVCIMKPLSLLDLPQVVYAIFNKTIHLSNYVEIIKCQNAMIERIAPDAIHIDGEPHLAAKNLDVKVVPGSLKVLRKY
jgi:YegS/Rv2252/BmrU family lipid kinase